MADAKMTTNPKPRTTLAAKPNPNATNSTAHGIITSFLHSIGLDTLGTWAWNRFKETGSIDLVKLEMEERPEYKTRFAGRLALRAAGIEMNEAQQFAWEQSAHDLMKQAGMPPGFYDQWQDFTHLISQGVSVSELSQRVNDAFLKVTNSPASVRAAMAEYYGAGSDSALAALALDTSKAAPVIMRQISASEAGGYLAQTGINIDKSLAERIAQATSYQEGAIQQGAQQIGAWNAQGVFDPRFGENGTDLNTGLAAGFERDQRAILKIQKEQEQRAASGQGSSTGTGGLGTAQH